MSKKTVALSVHKNTIEKRRRKAIQNNMVRAAGNMGKQDVRAFALVAISADGSALCAWDTGSILPLWGFAPTINNILSRDIEDSGVEDTWSPSLSETPT